MPTRPKTAGKAAQAVTTRPAPQPGGVFARLKAEAEKGRPPVEPYVIDDVDPPIVIAPPGDAESQFAFADLFAEDGSFAMKDVHRVLQLICGDAFDRVWQLVRKEHISVTLALIDDMGRHFQDQVPAAEVADFPGGTAASSS